MTKKLEINFTKKPEIVFQFDQFLNVEQAVDKFLNKKDNLKKLIAPLIPTNLEETIQKLIPEVSDGYTPQKGVDYDDGKDGETPSDEKIISLIKPQIPKVIPWKDGTTPKKGIDYFTKKELDEIKKELKTTILSEMPEHATKEEVNIKITEVLDKIRKLPTWGGGAQFLRQLMDVNVGNPTAQQYGLTYNPSRGEFALTAITGGGGTVDSVVAWTWITVDATDPANPIVATPITQYTDELAQDAVGWIMTDSAEIDFTYNDGTPSITASIVAWSIDESKLDASVNASLDLADTAVQPATLSSYELLANKATDFSTINNTLYPTVQAVNNAINTAVTGLLDYRGSYDASTNLFPATGGSGLLGAILKGDFWICSVAGTLWGIPVTAGDLIIAIVDTPWQTSTNWDLIENTLGYTPANTALSNLASVAINTSLVSDTDNTDNIGSSLIKWATGFFTNLGATGTRITKGWFTDIESTNIPTVNGSTLASALNLSGTNTWDQTSVTGNAWTATALQTARTIGTATGDVTSAGSTFDGSANNTNAYTLATVNSNVGSFGSATQSLSVTANGKGLITAISAQTVTPAVGSITGLGTWVATALWVNVGSAGAPVLFNWAGGTPSSLTLTNATWLPTAGLVDDAVTLAKMASGTAWNLITYDASGNPAAVATGTAWQVLTSNGAWAAPTMQTPASWGWVPKTGVSMGVNWTTQVITHGLGHTPTLITFHWGAASSSERTSNWYWDWTNNKAVCMGVVDTAKCISGDTAAYQAAVTASSSTTFTLTWWVFWADVAYQWIAY